MFALLLVLSAFPPLAAAEVSGYYEFYEIRATFENDRALNILETSTYVNPTSQTVKLTLNKSIPSDNVENIRIWDSSGDLSTQTSTANGRTSVTFETSWINPSQHYTFYENYNVNGMVLGSDSEYRLSLWGLTAQTRYDNFNAVVQGPTGSYPFLSSPEATLVSQDPPTWRYSTSLQENESFEGLFTKFYYSPVFYKVTLNRTLTSLGSTSGATLDTIVLNREIPWQFSSVISTSSGVNTMYFDAENNLHAVFDVGDVTSSSAKNVRVELLYEVDVHDPKIKSSDVGSISAVPSSLSPYLQSDSKWDVSNSVIQAAAQQAVGGETNAYSAAKKIFDLSIDTIEYEIQPERRGSLWVYQNKRGDCSEYTDLSIALARASGIPARAVYGWGYYENENLRGHAWLEYYLPNEGWQPADPTWGETSGNYFTTLDPIHLTRSVRGLSSTESWDNVYYYGSSLEGSETDDIQVVSASAAAQLYLTAAQYQATLAENMVGTSENSTLAAILQDALNELSSAQSASDYNEIILKAKSSISASNDIVLALGKPPEGQRFNVEGLMVYLAVVGVLLAVGVGVYFAVKRKRGSSSEHSLW